MRLVCICLLLAGLFIPFMSLNLAFRNEQFSEFIANAVESRFFKPPKVTKIRLKNRVVQEIEDKADRRKTTFSSSYRRVQKIKGARNRVSIVNK